MEKTEKAEKTLALNLSNQSNTRRCHQVTATQINTFVFVGQEYLENLCPTEGIPVSVSISQAGELTLNGLDKDMMEDRNLCIYTDKRISKSDEDLTP